MTSVYKHDCMIIIVIIEARKIHLVHEFVIYFRGFSEQGLLSHHLCIFFFESGDFLVKAFHLSLLACNNCLLSQSYSPPEGAEGKCGAG